MSAPTAPSWYDVLGVEPDADPEAIRTAWRQGIADLDPGARRFHLLNQAAETLLDHDRREQYDATLTATEAPEATEENPTEPALTRGKWRKERKAKPQRDRATSPGSGKPQRQPSEAGAPAAGTSTAGSTSTLVAEPEVEPAADDTDTIPAVRPRTGPRAWLLITVGVLAAVLVAAAAWLATQPSDGAIAADTSDAQAAAEQAMPTILAYDYRQMDADQKAADALMTPAYAAKYDALFAQLKANAARVKPVVTAQVLDSGIVRSGDDRVQVLVFVNRPTTNASKQDEVYHDQVVATMVKSGNGWLVDDLQTTDAG